jgi:hypothetical protein
VTAADNACALLYSGVTFRFLSRLPPVCQWNSQAKFPYLFINFSENRHMNTQKKNQEEEFYGNKNFPLRSGAACFFAKICLALTRSKAFVFVFRLGQFSVDKSLVCLANSESRGSRRNFCALRLKTKAQPETVFSRRKNS